MTKHDEARRAFLKGAALGAGAVAGLVPEALAQTHEQPHGNATAGTAQAHAHGGGHGAFLNDDDAATVAAFAERLMPGAPGKPLKPSVRNGCWPPPRKARYWTRGSGPRWQRRPARAGTRPRWSGLPSGSPNRCLRAMSLVSRLLIRGFDPLEHAIDYGCELIPLVRSEIAHRKAHGSVAGRIAG